MQAFHGTSAALEFAVTGLKVTVFSVWSSRIVLTFGPVIGAWLVVSSESKVGFSLACQVEHIIVIGHRNCGGIKALMSRKPNEFERYLAGFIFNPVVSL